jgi:glycosyltransferase involved in cell wall biosynthesis
VIVFVDHYGTLGGGQFVLLELLRELRSKPASPPVAVVCPPGALAEAVAAEGAFAAPADAPGARLELLDREFGISRVVVNGLRWLPGVLAWRSTRSDRGRAADVFFVQHSAPGTAARRAVARVLLRRVDRVIPVASTTARRANLVEVPPLGLTSARYDSLAARRHHEGAKSVKAFGRLDRVKGLDLLASALPTLSERHPSLRFDVAVAPPLERRSGRYAAKTYERLRPYLVEGPRDATWFEAGDVVVVPSRSETACLTAQEAMAAGAVVVAAGVGDLPFLIEDGVSGFLFAPGKADALVAATERALSASPDELAEIAARGRASAGARAGAWYAGVCDLLADSERIAC